MYSGYIHLDGKRHTRNDLSVILKGKRSSSKNSWRRVVEDRCVGETARDERAPPRSNLEKWSIIFPPDGRIQFPFLDRSYFFARVRTSSGEMVLSEIAEDMLEMEPWYRKGGAFNREIRSSIVFVTFANFYISSFYT